MAKVTVDITGFYFSIDVDATDGDTVLDVMRKAETQSGGGGKPVLRFMSTANGSIRTFSVEHVNAPVSRQYKEKSFFPNDLKPGFYEFTEKAPDSNNQLIAWQYYIMEPIPGSADGFRTLSADRAIEFAGASKFKWSDGMKIIWRGVLICSNRTTDFGKGGKEY
jgi:hypothetical protein